MKVVSFMAYKEAKSNVKWREKVREEKVKQLYDFAKKAVYYLEQDELEDLAGTIHDGNKGEIGGKVNELIFQGGLLAGIEQLVNV